MTSSRRWAVCVLLACAGCGGGGGSGGVESCTVSENAGSLGMLKICLEGPPSAFANGCKSKGPELKP